MLGFILTVITLMFSLDVLWWWRADRMVRALPWGGLWRGLVAAFVLAQMAAMAYLVFGRGYTGGSDPHLPPAVLSMTFIWHLLVLPTTIVTMLVLSLTRGAARIVRPNRRAAEPATASAPQRELEAPPAPETAPAAAPVQATATAPARGATSAPLTSPSMAPLSSRRAFLRAAAAAAPPLVATVGAARAMSQLDQFRVRPLDLAIPNLPDALDGLSIAHVSDTHVGDFTNGRTLQRIAEATNALRPDLVLLTGDLINRRLADLPAAVDMVRRMDPRLGLFLCEGNHDLFEGRGGFRLPLESAGVPLLANDAGVVHVRGQAVQVLGLQWGYGDGRRAGGDDAIATSLPPLLAKRDPGAFPILLAHHPHAFDAAAAAGIPLTLAGHTHGGQLNLTHRIGFGRMYRYWSGLYAKGDSRLVVSNGVGNWFPLRINAPAEIVHVTLRRG